MASSPLSPAALLATLATVAVIIGVGVLLRLDLIDGVYAGLAIGAVGAGVPGTAAGFAAGKKSAAPPPTD